MSRRAVRRYLVAYDVSPDRRRDRLAKLLLSYGDRVQYSVFVVDASLGRLQRMRAEVEQVIDLAVDSVLICDLGAVEGVEDSRFVWVGRRVPTISSEHFIV